MTRACDRCATPRPSSSSTSPCRTFSSAASTSRWPPPSSSPATGSGGRSSASSTPSSGCWRLSHSYNSTHFLTKAKYQSNCQIFISGTGCSGCPSSTSWPSPSTDTWWSPTPTSTTGDTSGGGTRDTWLHWLSPGCTAGGGSRYTWPPRGSVASSSSCPHPCQVEQID